jgi:hypothetical protein
MKLLTAIFGFASLFLIVYDIWVSLCSLFVWVVFNTPNDLTIKTPDHMRGRVAS